MSSALPCGLFAHGKLKYSCRHKFWFTLEKRTKKLITCNKISKHMTHIWMAFSCIAYGELMMTFKHFNVFLLLYLENSTLCNVWFFLYFPRIRTCCKNHPWISLFRSRPNRANNWQSVVAKTVIEGTCKSVEIFCK